jgi:hypothetical protein
VAIVARKAYVVRPTGNLNGFTLEFPTFELVNDSLGLVKSWRFYPMQLCDEGGVWCGVVRLDADTTLCAAAVSPLACLLQRRSASVPRGEPGSRSKPAINTTPTWWRNQIVAHIECRSRRPRVGQGEVLPWPQERSTSS